MAQRSTHELKRNAEGLAGKVLEHKVLLVLCLIVLAAGCCISAAGLGGGRQEGVTVERASGEAGSSGSADVSPSSDSGNAKKAASAELYVIDIDGAVAAPGVYRLAEGSRISDAIDAAGGLTDAADVSTLNRAAKLADGQKVHVPALGEEVAAAPVSSDPQGAGTAAASGAALININTATAEELQALSGVGPSTAKAIVEDREAHGPFSSIEDLMRVSGIGEKKFEKMRSQVCI